MQKEVHFKEYLTKVISREAAAALMCKLGCLTELLQSRARAKVPTALKEEEKQHYEHNETEITLKHCQEMHPFTFSICHC